MNVLIINPILNTAVKNVVKRRENNSDCMIYNFARGFVKNGHSVTIIAAEDYKPLTTEKYDFNVVYFKSILPKIFKPALLPLPSPVKLYKYLKRNAGNFDMIVSSESFSLFTLIAVLAVRKKLVVWQEISFHQKMFHKIPSKIWHNLVVRPLYQNVFTVGRSVHARDFISEYTNNVAFETVDHGANSDIFVPCEQQDHSFIIISILVKRKRIDVIIRKFAEFIEKSNYKDYILNIVGDGYEMPTLKRLAKELKLGNNVIFHGYMTHHEFAKLSSKSKALLIHTEKDMNMVSISESIVNGTPILTNTVPTNSSFVNRHNLGIVKDDWDWTDLVKMIERYPELHGNCLKIREQLTNTGCAKKMIHLFKNRNKKLQ